MQVCSECHRADALTATVQQAFASDSARGGERIPGCRAVTARLQLWDCADRARARATRPLDWTHHNSASAWQVQGPA